MAEEQAEIEEKGKSSVVKIVMIVLGILLLIVLSVVGTLFATGFFDKTEKESVEEQIAELEAEAEAEAEGLEGEGEAGGEPVPVPLETPELQKFKKSYKEIKKSFVSNIKGSDNYLSMEIAFSSYEGEKLGDFLKEYDPDFRNIIMKEIEKRKTNEFLGNDNRNKFLDAIRDSMNEFLISKEEDPIIFNAVFKTFVIKQG